MTGQAKQTADVRSDPWCESKMDENSGRSAEGMRFLKKRKKRRGKKKQRSGLEGWRENERWEWRDDG